MVFDFYSDPMKLSHCLSLGLAFVWPRELGLISGSCQPFSGSVDRGNYSGSLCMAMAIIEIQSNIRNQNIFHKRKGFTICYHK